MSWPASVPKERIRGATGSSSSNPDLDYRQARDIVARHIGPYAAGRLDKFARAIARADAPADYDNEPLGQK